MGLHERAWAGLNLMIYGKTPMVPMQLEQALAAATPNNEVRLESYEDYADALDFCKEKRNVGFIFLLENCGNLPVHDVFMQLARAYESKGWPVFGVLIHENGESFTGLRTIQRCSNILGYYPLTDFTDKTKASSTLESIWNKFNSSFENSIIPAPLQETFLSLATETMTTESIHFMDRVSVLLSSSLNVSWIETVSLRWAPVITAVSNTHSSALKPHATLAQICNLAKFDGDKSDLNGIITSKLPLCARISALSFALDEKRRSGTLAEDLKVIATLSKPGAPAVLRHLANARERILQIAQEEESNARQEHTG